jgi:hypothetical protein
MATSNMLAEAGMTSDELWRVVLSQAGDKPSPKLGEVSQQDDQNWSPSTMQDATNEAEENSAILQSFSQEGAQNCASSTMQDATAETQLSLF